MIQPNPLQQFFRKPKFSITLPSRGKWWPKDALALSDTKTLDILPMTALDDAKFRAGNATLTGNSLFDLIQSCVPGIKNAEAIPTIDLDAILLSIRRASYGNELELSFPVPNTTIIRKIKIPIDKLVADLPDSSKTWDSDLVITNELNEKLTLSVRPLQAKSLLATAKQLAKHGHLARKLMNSELDDSEKIAQLETNITSLSSLNIELNLESIEMISNSEGWFTKNPVEIANFMRNCDVVYFKALQTHLEEQKLKTGFKPIELISNEDELKAGAPETWSYPVLFELSDFFAL